MAERRVPDSPTLGGEAGDIPLVPLRPREPSPAAAEGAASDFGSTAAIISPVVERSARPERPRMSQALTLEISELNPPEQELQDATTTADGMSVDELLAVSCPESLISTHLSFQEL